MSEKKTYAERLRALDPRAIYVLLTLAVVVPILFPLGLPIQIAAPTRDVYNAIEGLKGGAVWYGIDLLAVSLPEMMPALVVTVRHLMTKPVKIVFVSFTSEGPMYYYKLMDQLKTQKKYGEDFAYLGFIPGEETAIAAYAHDVPGTAKKDYFGSPVEALPVMKGIKTAKDFALVITCISLSLHNDAYVRQVFTPFNVKMVQVMLSVNYPEKILYYPHQIVGALNGIKGATEYEQLTGYLGAATSANDAITMAHVLLILFVVVANIGYFASGRKR